MGDRESRNRFTRVELAERILQIAVSDEHSALITEKDQVWVCGDNEAGQLGLNDNKNRNGLTHVDLPKRVSQIDARSSYTVFITEDDYLWLSGSDPVFSDRRGSSIKRIGLAEAAK